MPNGGSDCCGTCWFNRSNRGQAGHGKGDNAIEPVCEIRDFAIESPFHTYCANHPRRAPERDAVPVGPVWVDSGSGREVCRPSPDSGAIRNHLLACLAGILQSSYWQSSQSGGSDDIGFRVATVPEPSSLILAALGLIGFAAWGWRRKR